MKSFFIFCVLFLGLSSVCLEAEAQGAFTLTNSNDASTQVFTNSLGTAVLTNGMIVFEGQLDAAMSVVAATDGSGRLLASVQLLAQIKLFDELPSSNEVGTAQGAVAALRDGIGLTTGKYFAWGSTNNVMEWVPLLQTNSTLFAVTEGATNYITFIFNYTLPAPVTYQVFIGETPDVHVPSLPVTSLTTETDSINGVSLLGTGALQTYGTASGSPGPLSSSVSLSVYATSKGVLMVVDTVNEQDTGRDIIVKAKINGVWTEIGRKTADGSAHYEIYDNNGLLTVGGSYEFKVIDELGNEHTLGQEVEVKTIKMDSVTLEPSTLRVSFNTESGKAYQVFVAESLDSQVWTAAVVYYPKANGEEGYSSEPFTANSSSTTVRIPLGENEERKPKAFFKIIKVQ